MIYVIACLEGSSFFAIILSFKEGESDYRTLKVVHDGSIAAQSDNMLIYTISNRRHLLLEWMSDNAGYKTTEVDDLHPGETVEKKFTFGIL